MNNRIRTKIFDIGNILIPVTLAFGVGAVFCLMIGYNPWTVFGVIIRGGFGSKAGWMQTLGFSCPIITVSYTHLDVYKRQAQQNAGVSLDWLEEVKAYEAEILKVRS